MAEALFLDVYRHLLTDYTFLRYGVGVARGRAREPTPPIEISPMTKMFQKAYCFFSFSFFLAFFCLQQ